MKLSRTYDEEDYEETIMVVSLHHEERQKEIKHEKKLNKVWSKKDEGKRNDSSQPESSNHTGDRKKPYDKEQKKTRLPDTSQFKDNDEPKRMYHNK
jgi:hypothetical protein